MKQTLTRPSIPSLAFVREAFTGGSTRCTVCGGQVRSDAPSVRVRGVWFHSDCAGYRPRAARSS